MKKHFIEAKHFGGFVTFYLPCSFLRHISSEFVFCNPDADF